MRIAVASEGLEVCPPCRALFELHVLYRVNRGVITECQNLPNPGLAVPGATMAELLEDDRRRRARRAAASTCDMANAFCHAGIEVVAGAARERHAAVAESYLNHTLIGTEELCHLLDEAADADDEELESAFGRIEKQLESASR